MVRNLDLPPEPGSAPAKAVEPPEQDNCYSQDARVAFAAPWSLVPGGRATTLASSPRQSPLVDLKPQVAFAKWDFKQ